MKYHPLACVLLIAALGWAAVGSAHADDGASLADAYSDALTASDSSSSAAVPTTSSLSVLGRTTPHPHTLEAAPASLAETSTTTFTSRVGTTTNAQSQSQSQSKSGGIGNFLRKKARKLMKKLRKRRAAAKAYSKKRNRKNRLLNSQRGGKFGREGDERASGGLMSKFARAFNQPIVVPLPKSKFGIPSEMDEECVVCQYLVQRIQTQLFQKVVSSNLGVDNAVFGGGAPALNAAAIAQAALNSASPGVPNPAAAATNPAGSVPGIPRMGAMGSNLPVPAVMAAASVGGPFAGGADLNAPTGAQHALLIKKTNSKLRRLPGGRGIVRIVAEDVTRSICHTDRMPTLFYPYCQRFKSRGIWRSVKKGLFFNFPVASVCFEAGMCGKKSYIAGKGAVHMPKSSNKFNSLRGLCGLKGGLHERSRVKELYCTTSG